MEIVYPAEEKKALHPLGIFKQGFGIWKQNFLILSNTYLIFYLPLFILQVIQLLFFSNTSLLSNKIIAVAMWLAAIAIGSWGSIALFLTIKKALSSAANSVSENMKDSAKYFLPYIGAILLISGLLWVIVVATGIGVLFIFMFLRRNVVLGIAAPGVMLIAGLVAAVYFTVRCSLSNFACVIDDKTPVAALKRSHFLVKNYVNPVIGEICLFLLLALLCYLPSAILFGGLKAGRQPASPGALVYLFLVNIFLTPLWSSVFVVLYYKLKEVADRDVRA